MAQEFEVKFLEINPKEVEQKLVKLGAKKVFDKVFRVRIFDYPDLRLHNDAAWFRVRDEGDKITMAFKKRLGIDTTGKANDLGMQEHEVEVNDFETACNIMFSLGLIQKFYEEKRRIRYLLDNLEFDIDHCPGIKPFLEIEAPSWEKVDKAISLLDLDPKDKKVCSAYQIYETHGINMLEYEEFRFDSLVKRKKKIG